MNKTMKFVTIALLVVVMMAAISSTVLASTFDPGALVQNITNAADANTGDTSDLTKMAGNIIALIRNVAVIAGVILLSILGIKYMLGSAEEKADYKKSLIPLVVGIVVVMAASQIITMVFNFFK